MGITLFLIYHKKTLSLQIVIAALVSHDTIHSHEKHSHTFNHLHIFYRQVYDYALHFHTWWMPT